MMAAQGLEDRDALYYPYIHLRDETWLRSSLLFFPHLLRMVPPDYPLNDTSFVRDLAETVGRRGQPLVGSYPLNSPAACEAGWQLAKRFAEDAKNVDFRRKYGRTATKAGFPSDSVFQIHKDKFVFELESVLREANLMWEPSRPERGASWAAVHPAVGEVIMSTMAVAAARDRGCDVLTDTERTHVAAATDSAAEIYATLLSRRSHAAEPRKPQVYEIGGLVLATTFDVSTLKVADFAALSREREALFDFRKHLAERAAKIPAMGDGRARLDAAKEAAAEIVEEWEASRKTYGHFFKRLLRLDAADEARGAATELLEMAVSTPGQGAGVAAAGVALLGVVPGLAVGVAYYGMKTWRDLGVEEQNAPTRFLSKVAERGATLATA